MSEAARTRSCRSPRCPGEPRGDDGWCAFHREILDRVRAELQSERDQVNRRAAVKKQRSPTCTIDDCYEAKRPGDPYCAHHADLIETMGVA